MGGPPDDERPGTGVGTVTFAAAVAAPAGCHRSMTVARFVGVLGLGLSDAPALVEGFPSPRLNSAVAFTLFSTNPLPCNLVKLGLKSFCTAGRENAEGPLVDVVPKNPCDVACG